MARKKVVFSEHEDNLIRRAYSAENYGSKNGIMSLASRLNKSATSIHRQAGKLGLLKKSHSRVRQLWTEEEERIVEDNSHKGLEAINYQLKKCGYQSRSLESIKSKMRHLGLGLRSSRQDCGNYTQNSLAKLMGINGKVIGRYIKEERLKATFRKGLSQNEYEIKASDVKKFFKDNLSMIDISKCDKYWLVDLLTGEIK